MKIKNIVAAIEEAAPLAWQEDYDNSGLLVGDPEADISSALLCVDITEAVLQEAVETGAGMVIAHHPVIFHPLKRLTGSTYIERVVARAVREGIALYACHTNLDSAPHGMSYALGNILGLKNVSILSPSPAGGHGMGITGEVEETETLGFLRHVKEILGLKVLRHSDITRPMVSRVALCTGAGGSMMEEARAAGAQLYISADFRYNAFLDADRDMVIADVGHFESEYCAIDILHDIIRKKMPTFALRRSARSVNPVNYLL